MKKIKIIVLFVVLPIVFTIGLTSCFISANKNSDSEQRGPVRVMFYNVENLFDIYDDPYINDEEFLPNGVKHWNFTKYKQKLDNIAKVITAVGEWETPEIIGLCEIENLKVLEDIIKNTSLSKVKYGIVHKDSPDKRGIDVAILYRKDRVKPLSYRAIAVEFPGESFRPTRDILYFECLVNDEDTIHYFVNHWPSRWGGAKKSEPKRIRAAKTLRKFTDSLLKKNPNAKIIITGDFNDDPNDKSLKKILGAKKVSDKSSSHLYNLSLQYLEPGVRGSLKYRGNWNVFDQFIVSDALLNAKSGLSTSVGDCHIFYGTPNNEFLLEKDTRNVGMQPSRTYWGMKFHGGFSDHLPVYLDLR